jgi:hypothetical protein
MSNKGDKMKLRFDLTDKMMCEIDGDTQRDLFEQIASMSEVFGSTCCSKCKSGNIRYIVRTNKEDDKFYEILCLDCFAKLSFGCNKKGGSLFPHRYDAENKKPLANGGWLKYNKETGQNE